MKKSDVISILRDQGLSPNRNLGQNFLTSEIVIGKIMQTVAISSGDSILEVGPGLGALTLPLAETGNSLTAVELDGGFASYLKERLSFYSNVEIVNADFLKMAPDDRFTRIVSNLPYYCASEMLYRFAEYSAPRVYVMVQKEMGERILASPGNKSYGAMTVTLGLYYEAFVRFHVSRNDFYPRPDVDFLFIALSKRDLSDLPITIREEFHRVVKSAFWGRRKTVLKSLADSPHLDFDRDKVAAALEGAGIDQKIRGEDLSRDIFLDLARELAGVRARG